MPRVTFATVSTVKPDRLEDAIELGRSAGKLMARHRGAGRLFSAGMAGEQTGSMLFTVQFDSIEQAAAAIDAMMADSEVTEFMNSMARSTSPTVLVSSSMATEIPLAGKLPQGKGSVLEVHVTKPTPGRFDTMIEEATKAGGLLAKAGAANILAFQIGYAGMQSGLTGMAIEWESSKAQLLGSSVFTTDPVGQELATTMMNGTGGSTLVTSGVYHEIPL